MTTTPLASLVETVEPWQGKVYILLGMAKAHWPIEFGRLPITLCGSSASLVSAAEHDPASIAVDDRCRSFPCARRWERFDREQEAS